MPKQTTLNAIHRAAHARMVDFGGWDMPVNYGSQIEEHHAVRSSAGLFDVSHMLVIDLEGSDARAFLRRALRLARRGWGWTAPNPLVGAVVVRDGIVAGEGKGYTPTLGGGCGTRPGSRR